MLVGKVNWFRKSTWWETEAETDDRFLCVPLHSLHCRALSE